MSAFPPDLAVTVRRVVRQLTALADELQEAAPPPPVAFLHLAAEIPPARARALYETVAAATEAQGIDIQMITLPPGGRVPPLSDPDIQDWGPGTGNTWQKNT